MFWMRRWSTLRLTLRILSLVAVCLALSGCSLPATELVDCTNCKGAGVIDCLGCGGSGNAKILGPNLQEQGFRECWSCQGKGTFPCGFCGGTGQTRQMVKTPK